MNHLEFESAHMEASLYETLPYSLAMKDAELVVDVETAQNGPEFAKSKVLQSANEISIRYVLCQQ